MPAPVLRVLLLADTHLGFDLPARPRVARRRRGPDFFANFERALEPALAGDVDLVVHGGDLLYRSKVRRQLVLDAFEPLRRVADAGVPVVVVPGNHERSSIPFPLLASHSGIHIFSRAETVRLEIGGTTVALAGFPCRRDGVAGVVSGLIEETGFRDAAAGVRLLCLHQTVEGARVGPAGFTFRRGRDVIPGAAIPDGFAAVLAGHIHRAQVLETDLAGRALAAPVLYPGSIERTSFAERDETKGYMALDLEPSPEGGRLLDWRFHELPARPMVSLDLDLETLNGERPLSWLERRTREISPDAVVRIRLSGAHPSASRDLRARDLRSVVPSTMTLDLRWPRVPAEDALPK